MIFSVNINQSLYMYIYENPDWPHFIVDLSRTEKLEDKISELKYFLDGMLMMISDRNSEIASFCRILLRLPGLSKE